MNKNLLKSFAAAAMSVLALACAKEPVTGDGQTVEATFSVDVPGVDVSTKGLSDAASVNELICQVFLNDGNYTRVPDLNQTVPVTAKKAKVTFSLVKGQKYAFIFWAQTKGTGYYNTEDLRSVKMNVDAVKANEPKMDAFWATATKTATATASSESKTLYRALAQVNFGQESLNRSDKLTVTESMVKATGVPDTFHPFAGNTSNACEGSVDITFAKNAAITDEKLNVGNVDYDYLATAYVFAPKSKSILSDVSATFTFDNGKSTTVNAPNAPLQGNYRTNILGNLLTVGAEWNITVDPDFKGGDITYDAVSANLEAGKEVTLSEDYSVADKSNGVTIGVGVTSVLNLNGKKFSNKNAVTDNKAALQVHGDLTINGEGEVYCAGGAVNNAIIVEQGGHLVINGGTYNVGKANSGKSNATIFVFGPDINGRNGSVEINGGVFMAEAETDDTPFVLNQSDDITVNCFSVKGGTFVGFNPASVNEAHGAITSFVAEGYKSVKTTYEGKQAWEVKPIEPVGTQEDFKTAAAEENATVVLSAGNYSLPSTIAEGVTILGSDGTVIDIPTAVAYHNKNLTFKNVTMKSPNANYTGIQHAASVKYVDCTIEGQPFSYAANAVFEKCTFNQTSSAAYNIWTYGSTNITFNDCVFNCAGKGVLIYNEGSINKEVATFNNCKFIATTPVTGKAAIEIDSTFSEYEVHINGCTESGFDAGSVSGNSLWNKKKGNNKVEVFVDGLQVL